MNQAESKWPYEVAYGRETAIRSDLLIIGGGIAGCHAAIEAARKGLSVTVVDKAPIIRSGNGGTGVDHWHCAYTNPCSRVTPDEMAEVWKRCRPPLAGSEFGSLASFYIAARESYDILLDIEKMGMVIRDVNDEFKGAAFRDDETKLMFAYDYKNRCALRIPGGKIKVVLYREMKRLGVRMVEHVMATKLLTKKAAEGNRVVGATGLSLRTGEFYVFSAKATLLCAGISNRLWVSGGDAAGAADSSYDPNGGDGVALAWEAGAEFVSMEATSPGTGPMRYPSYSTGNCHNTWYGCEIVDSEGKHVPWVDRDGNELKDIMERFYPAKGQEMFIFDEGAKYYELSGARPTPELADKIRGGEYKLPLYADLGAMPELERKAIWQLMVANEGRGRVPVYENYTKAGFDPEKDMLQVNMTPFANYGAFKPWANGQGAPQWRDLTVRTGGGMLYDWDLRTNVEGLYVAGQHMAGGSNHAHAACVGRYAARHAAAYAGETERVQPDRSQIDAEKERVYAPVSRTEGYHWKELRTALNRIMCEYCGVDLSDEGLRLGLYWLGELRCNEAKNVVARNPHELARSLEWLSRMTTGEVVMNSALARKRDSRALNFQKLDAEEACGDTFSETYVAVRRREDGTVETRELSPSYLFQPPYAPTCRENYEAHKLL